jgi:hypothetical protein
MMAVKAFSLLLLVFGQALNIGTYLAIGSNGVYYGQR